jgi:hypothetical protein
MRFILHLCLGFIFGITLLSVTTIATWQFWVIFLLFIFDDGINQLITVITQPKDKSD